MCYRSKWRFGLWVVAVWFLSIVMLSRAARAEPLKVSEAERILNLVVEFDNLEGARPDRFKLDVRLELVRRVREALRKSGTLSKSAVENAPLWAGSATALLTDAERQKVDEARAKIASQAAAALDESTVELSWTFGQLRWHLRRELLARLATQPAFVTGASPQDLQDWADAAVAQWMRLQVDTAYLRAVAAQPEWLQQLLGEDRAKVQAWLAEIDPPAPQLPADASPEQARAQWSKFRERTLAADKTSLASEIRQEVVRLRQRLGVLHREASDVRELLHANAQRLFVDLPPEHGQNAPFLRLRLAWPDGNEQASRVGASAFLVWPRPPVQVQAAPGRGGPAALTVPATMPAVVSAADEVPLGISFRGLQIDKDGHLSLPPDAAPQINVNTAQLQSALRRFGLPEPVVLQNVRFVEPSLKTFTFDADVDLPVSEERLRVRVSIDPAQLVAEGGMARMLRQIKVTGGRSLVEHLQDEFIGRLKEQVASTGMLQVGGPDGVRAGELSASGDWSDGTLQITAKIRLGTDGPAWPVGLQLVRDNERWRVRPAPHVLPGEVIDWLRGRALAALAGALGSDMPRLDRLSRTVTLTKVVYDANENRVSGVLTVPVKVAPVNGTLSLPFSVDLRGNVSLSTGDALATLKASLNDLLNALIAEAQGAAGADLAASLNGKTLALPGMTVSVRDAVYEAPAKRYRAMFAATVAGTEFGVGPVYLLDFKIEGGAVTAPRLDLTDARITPDPAAMLSKALGVDSLPVRISQPRGNADGIQFSAELNIPELGQPLPLGEFSLGTKGTNWDRAALTAAIQSRAAELLKGKRFELPDVGPISDLAIDPAKGDIAFLPTFSLRVRGTMTLTEGVSLPVTVQIKPSFKVDVEDAVLTAVIDPLVKVLRSELLPPDLSGFTIENFKRIDPWARPYGVMFDASIDVLGMKVKVTQLKVTQAGLRLPDMVSVQLPGTYPIGTSGLVLVDPGVGLPLRKDVKRVDLLGNITVGSDGVDKVIKIAAEMQLFLPDLRLDLQGRTILFDKVPVFQVKGAASLKTGRMELESRTVGLIDRVVSVRGMAVLDAKQRLFSQAASIGIFGLKVADTDMLLKIDDKNVLFDMSGRADLVLVTAHAHVGGALPEISRFKADAHFKTEVAGFTLSGARIEVASAKAELGCEVIGIKLTVIVPGISQLTPGTVADAILSLLDFDFDLSALLKRDIVIDLRKPDGSPAGGGTVGQPEPHQPKQEPDAPPPPGGGLAHVDEAPAPSGGTPPPPPAPEGPKIPSEVYMYQGGDSALKFRPDPENPGMFIGEYVRGGAVVDQEHYPVSQQMMDRLKRVILIGREYFPKPDGALEPQRCTYGNQHPAVEMLIGLDQGEAKVYLLYLSAHRIEPLNMDDSPVQLIKPGPLNEFWNFITGGSQGKQALRPGDIRLLNEWARSKAVPQYQAFDYKSSRPFNLTELNAASGLALPDVRAYRYKRVDEHDVPVWRVGVSDPDVTFDVPVSSPLAPLMTSDLTSDHYKRLLAHILAARLKGENVEVVEADSGLGNVVLLLGDDRLVFFTSSGTNSISVRTPGAFNAMRRDSAAEGLWSKLRTELPKAPAGSALWVARVDQSWRTLTGTRVEENVLDWSLRLMELRNGAVGPATPRTKAADISGRYEQLLAEDQVIDPARPPKLDSPAARQWLIERLLEPVDEVQKHMSVSPTLLLKEN
jgi:hypothetical protein